MEMQIDREIFHEDDVTRHSPYVATGLAIHKL
jgi:hypothetical protein